MKVPGWSVPLLVIVLAMAGLGAARVLSIPSLTLDFATQQTGAARTVTLLVDGVKCVDTAQRAASTLAEIPGVSRFVAFASRNRVEVTYDPEQASPAALREALEGPIWAEETGEFLFNVFEVVEIDGQPVSP